MTGRCIEMMGGVGFVKDFPVEKFYRDSKIGRRILYVVAVDDLILVDCLIQVKSMKAHRLYS